MRPPPRRNAPPPTRRSAPTQGGMAREVRAMDKNALKSHNKVALTSQYKSQSRNVTECPRKIVSRSQSEHLNSPAHLSLSRTASRSQRKTAAVYLSRVVPVYQYKHLPRWLRRFAVVGVVAVAIMVNISDGYHIMTRGLGI